MTYLMNRTGAKMRKIKTDETADSKLADGEDQKRGVKLIDADI